MEDYKKKLESEMFRYMEMPISERTLSLITKLGECWMKLNTIEHCFSKGLSLDDAREWVEGMTNEDGTEGEHWTVDETLEFKPEGVGEAEWYATMNMVYSDYYKVAEKYGVNKAEFYVDMAKAFILDEDAPKDKVARYRCMVKE